METVQSYKCPCCGASLIFQNESLHCDSCGNDFELDAMRQIEDVGSQMQGESKYDWEHYEPRSYETNGEIELACYTCPSCGAEITGDDTMGSTVCPYCGDAAVIKGLMHKKLCAMKTAVKEDYAGNYMKPNSMNLDFSRDIFLYSTVTKTEKTKSDSGSHTSSSGRSHGGRGGSF